MLGSSADEFDVAVIVHSEFDPTEYYVRLAIAGRGTWPEAEEWHHHFAALGVTKMVYATLAIVRHERPHAPFTVRRQAGSATGARELGQLVRAAEESASAAAYERLLASRPVLASHVTLRSEHVREDGEWAVRSCALVSEVPFDVRLPCPPDMVAVIGGMNGSRTVRELFGDLAGAGTLRDDATIDRLASFIHMLAAHGFVELRGSVGLV
jgi:hypothetical protein